MKIEIQKAENGGYMIRNPRTGKFRVLESTDNEEEDARDVGMVVIGILAEYESAEVEEESGSCCGRGAQEKEEPADDSGDVDDFIERKGAELLIDIGSSLFDGLRKMSRKPSRKGRVVTVKADDVDPKEE